MLGINGLDHIVLMVRDIERSLAFYQEALGLTPERVDQWRRGEVSFPSLRINESTIIDLVQAPADPPSAYPNLAHFCLVTGADDLAGIARRLEAAGVKIETGPVVRSGARGDGASLYFSDPDGNVIELRTYAPEAIRRARGAQLA